MNKLGKIIPVRENVKPFALFPDEITADETALLELADGTRTPPALAAELKIAPADCEKLIAHLLRLHYLRAAALDEIRAALATLPNLGRHNDAIALAQHLLTEQRGDLPTLTLLAGLYEITARPADAAAQWQFISQIHQHEHRSGEALRAARKAAALQPLTHHLQIALADLCLQTHRETEAVRVFCAYARRLHDNKMEQAALAALDYAARQLPNNDALMLVEAEILTGQTGRRRARSPALKKKTPFNLITLLSLIFAILISGALAYAAYDYAAREKQLGAIETASRAWRELPLLSPYRRAMLAESIEENLKLAAPRLAWFQTPDYANAVSRAKTYRERADNDLQTQREKQRAALTRWRENPRVENEKLLGELLLIDDLEMLPEIHAEWKTWLSRDHRD